MATKIGIPEGPAKTKPAVTLSKEEVMRYSRHLIMPEVGMDGQLKLKQAKVLCIGTGGLGAPARSVSGGGGRGPHRPRGFRCGGFDESAAPGSLRHERRGQSEDSSGRGSPAQSESGYPDRHVRDASLERKRARYHEGLRHRRRRHGQFPDALSRQRRLRDPRQAQCLRLDFPFRGPDHDLRLSRTAHATAACIPSRPRRALCHRAPKAECWACCRESSARSRPPRR